MKVYVLEKIAAAKNLSIRSVGLENRFFEQQQAAVTTAIQKNFPFPAYISILRRKSRKKK